MRRGDRSSWQVVEDEPDDLHLVLFVRDCLRLAPQAPDQPGPLIPGAPDLRVAVSRAQREAAAVSWPGWWRSVLSTRWTSDAPSWRGPSGVRLQRAAWPIDPPGFESLTHSPGLRAAVRATHDAFTQWWSPPVHGAGQAAGPPRAGGGLGLPGVKGQLIDLHVHRLTVTEAVGRIERELGRAAKPFELRIDVLAVERPRVVVQRDGYVAVSGGLVRDEPAFRHWLHGVVRRIA